MKNSSSKYFIALILGPLIGLFVSCKQAEPEPMIAAGYIDANSSAETIIIKGDTIGVRHFTIDEQTILVGGEIVEGNVVEVIYMPPQEDGELPCAITITTDKTYPKALGRWATAPKAPLQIDLELKPRGRILQHQPQQTLRFTSWQLSGYDNKILLHGIISLPPEIKKSAKSKRDEELAPPTRRERSFKISATLTKQSDSNTESRQVMVVRTDDGRESRLYLQE